MKLLTRYSILIVWKSNNISSKLNIYINSFLYLTFYCYHKNSTRNCPNHSWCCQLYLSPSVIDSQCFRNRTITSNGTDEHINHTRLPRVQRANNTYTWAKKMTNFACELHTRWYLPIMLSDIYPPPLARPGVQWSEIKFRDPCYYTPAPKKTCGEGAGTGTCG